MGNGVGKEQEDKMRQIQISMQDVSFGYERDRQILKRDTLEMGAQ